jgi:lipopolysaccharide export system protein LptC
VAMTGTIAARGAASRAGAFRAAARNTRRVRVLRFSLPVLAIVLSGAFVAAVALDPRNRLGPKLDIASLGVNGATVTMERPRLTGTGNGRRTYEVTAMRAEQNIAEVQKIDLTALAARMQMRDNGWAALTAEAGHLDGDKKLLTLAGSITIDTDLGDRARMESAFVDFGQGRVDTSDPVEIQIGRSTLRADRMSVTQSGEVAVFEGRVVLVMQPDAAAPAEARP